MADEPEVRNDYEGVRKIGEKIKDIRICMMTTISPDGRMSSRPMAMQDNDFDGDLWFFTLDDTEKAQDIQRNGRVNLAFSQPSDQNYVSLIGHAMISYDKTKMAGLWNPTLRAWFPQELETPGIALIHVRVEQAELWDSPNSALAHIIGLVKSSVTGQQASGGEHEIINIPPASASV